MDELLRRRRKASDPGGIGSTVVTADRLLSIREVAEWLQIPVQTLYQWRYRREGPPTLKIGKHLRYRAADVEAWLETCR